MYLDMNTPDRELTPGVDLWTIAECSATKSSGGDPMLKVKFRRVSNENDHLYDNILLAGPGWGIGKRKLSSLIDTSYKGEFDPIELVGRKLWVETEVREYKGKSNLAVNIEGLACAGYQPESDVPAGKTAPEPKPEADGAPF